MDTWTFEITIFLQRRHVIKTEAVNMFTQLRVDWSSIINHSYAKDDKSTSETHFSSLTTLFVSQSPRRGASHVIPPVSNRIYEMCWV
jgi:hypothetical protein